MTVKDKKIFGKGTCYGKGPLLSWLHAIQAYRESGVELPVNIKFIVDSLHENEHAGLERILYVKQPTLLSDIDFVVVNESEWLGLKMPCISYGTIGKFFFLTFCGFVWRSVG